MFGWFRRKEKRVSDGDIGNAYELGRRAADSANADIEAFMNARFYPGISTIADAVFGDLNDSEVPPLVLARIDVKNFLERLDSDLRPRMIPPLHDAMAGWINAGLGSETGLLIEHHYKQFKTRLALTVFQRFLDMAEELKRADDRWRAINPEKASQIPYDTLGAEVGDLMAPYLR